eukprot:s3597_g5.t1
MSSVVGIKDPKVRKIFSLGAGDPADVQTRSLNIEIMAEVKHAWDGLMAPLGTCTLRKLQMVKPKSDEFCGIQNEPLLLPQKGGVYHPTDLKLIKASNEPGRSYTAGANISWASPFWTPCSVPAIRSAVKLLTNSKWRQPKILEMEVMVNTMSDPNNSQHRLGSLLKRLSPEEDHISYVLATWRDVSMGEKVQRVFQVGSIKRILASRMTDDQMVSVWLWKLQQKPKLLALLDQHLPRLRKALENHQTFREHFGGMEPRSQKAADFASKFLYEMTCDFAIKQAVRHQQSLEEVLEHSGVEKAWAEIIGPQAAKLSAGDVEGETEVSKSSLLIQVLPHEHLERLSQPEHAAKLEVVENGIELARKQVRSQAQTVDGSMSLDKLAKSFRTMECSKLRGTNDSSVIFLYIVEAAGEHERDARRSPTPMRREHMEKLLKAWMLTRSPDMPDLESEKLTFPQLHPSDVTLGLKLL